MINGIIPVNKPAGWTSFDAVNKIKHLTGFKVGHLGSLDPMATGVLLITINKATKLFDIMQQKNKTYLAKFKFGYSTDSLDATGSVVESCSKIPTRQQIEAVLPKFKGKISQVPPNYSAKSIGGVRAYSLARKNVDFVLPAKEITIFDIDLVGFENAELTLDITCSSGTYIRAIGRDLAIKLNSLATMTELTRTKLGEFELADCVEIADLNKDNVTSKIVSIDKVLNYPILKLDAQQTSNLLNGQTLLVDEIDGEYFVTQNKNIVAIAKIANKKAKMQIFLG